MKKIIFMLCLLSCFIGFSNKRSMINFMRSHNRHLSFEESSFIYDVTMHYASIYKVDPVLVFSVMKTESHFNHSTVSSAGGIMHLKRDFDRTRDTVKTLVCYNAGCGRLENNKWLSIKETTDYISKINRIYPVIKKILFDNGKVTYSQKNQNTGNYISEKTVNEDTTEEKKIRRLKIIRDQFN